MSQISDLKDAANTTTGVTLPPLDALAYNRIEAYVTKHDIDLEVVSHLRQVYVMGMQDAAARLCQLFETS